MSRYWGEERDEQAIYAVYLKKIKYCTPDKGNEHNSRKDFNFAINRISGTDTVAHLHWETVKECVIKAATLNKLTECLLSENAELDTRHFNVFFATYRAFSTAAEIANLLVGRYEQLAMQISHEKDLTLNGLRSVLVCWLDLSPDDFYEPPNYFSLHLLLGFARRHTPRLQDVVLHAANLLQKFRMAEAAGTSKRAALSQLCLNDGIEEFSPSDVMHNMTARKMVVDLQHLSARHIAQQLTFYDSEIFKRVITHQCLGCFWSRRHKVSSEEVYSVRATIDQFNAVSQRVMTSLLLDIRPSVRSKLLLKWIDVIQELRILKNFSSLKAVLSALRSEPVYRLKSVWSMVPHGKIKDFEEHSQTFSEENNSSGAREILEKEGTAKTVQPKVLRNGCRKAQGTLLGDNSIDID